MRIERRNVLLALLLGAVIGADVVLDLAREEQGLATPLFEQLDPARVARIVIEAPGAEPLELVREDGQWRLALRDGFPALEYAVEQLLRGLGGISSADQVSDERATHASLGVGSESGRVRVIDAEGRTVAELHSSGPGVGTESHVRPVGSDAVFRAPSLAGVEARTTAWIDGRLVSCDPLAVRGLSVLLPEDGVALSLERAEDGRWTHDDRLLSPLPPARVEPFLRSACSLVLADLAPREGADPGGPWLALELDLEGGEQERVWIGALFDENHRLARDPDWPQSWQGLLSVGAADRLRQAALSLTP